MLNHRLTTRGALALLVPIVVALAFVLSLCGLQACATTNTAPLHPGAINAFDSAAYDTLITVQASLNQAKTLIGGFPQYKNDLNTAIAAYNVAIAAYKTYHATVPATSASTAALQTELTSLVNQVAALLKNLGVSV
jgi:hypothetical protein